MRATSNSLMTRYRRIACGATPAVVGAVFLSVGVTQSWSSQLSSMSDANVGFAIAEEREVFGDVMSAAQAGTFQMAAVGSDQVTKATGATKPEASKKNISGVKSDESADKASVKRRVPEQPRLRNVQRDDAQYTLSMVDRIQLRVPGSTSVSGEYNLSPDNTISVPGVGRMDVADLTPRNFERKLSRVLSRLMRREVSVSMTVIRYKPFYITGQIRRPGAFDWRPGLTLIQAASVAGGLATSRGGSGADGSPERELLVRRTQQRLGFALARLARFTAERDGLSSIQSTGLLDGFLDTGKHKQVTGLADFIKRQNEMLAERIEINGTRLTDLRRSKASAEQELKFALEREQAVTEQVKIARKLEKSMEKLRKARLAPNSRYLARKSELIRNEVALTNVKHIVARARTRLETAQQRLDVLSRDRRALLSERIETIETEVAQHRIVLGDDADTGQGGLNGQRRLSYYIARRTERGVETIVASLFTELVPGDVVIISNSPETRDPMVVSNTESPSRHAGAGRRLDVHEQQMQQIMQGSISVRTARDTGPRRR